MATPENEGAGEPQREMREQEFIEEIGRKANRKIRARKESKSVWYGLGTMGMVGWSVAVPAVLGALIGTWLDAHVPASFSWRLTLLILGILVGCLNAWYWVSKERKKIERERNSDDDI